MTTSWQPYSNHLGKLKAAYLQPVDNIEATSEYHRGNLVTTSCQPHVNLMSTLFQPCQPLQPHGNFLETSHKFLGKFWEMSG